MQAEAPEVIDITKESAMTLEQRAMLDETLVVWGGEFGRTPMSERGNGRDHNPSDREHK